MQIELFFPEFFGLKSLWLKLLDEEKTYFNKNTVVKGIYGSFPNMKWNGGRVCLADSSPSYEEIEETFRVYKERDVNLTLCLTNMALKEEHYSDEYCNKICEIASKYNASCNIVDNNFGKYLESKFPKLKQNKSIIANYTKDTVDYNNYIVVNSKYNHDFEYLSSLEYKDRVVLHVTETCSLTCPRAPHYYAVSLAQLAGKQCDYDSPNCIYTEITQIKPKDVQKYLDIGINKFKFDDRDLGDIYRTLYKCCEWLIQPEYVEIIFKKYLKYFNKNIKPKLSHKQGGSL